MNSRLPPFPTEKRLVRSCLRAAKAFERVSEAYTTLTDAYKRAEYDAELDGGGTGEEGVEEADGAVMTPDMPSGPPGLKKRKARPARPPGRR